MSTTDGVDVAGETGSPELPEELAVALAALTPVEREVLLLHAWEELDRGEIAAALGCSTANVSVRLHRAKRRFERVLAAQEVTSQPITTSEGATDGC